MRNRVFPTQDPDHYDCRGGMFGCFVWAAAFVLPVVVGIVAAYATWRFLGGAN